MEFPGGAVDWELHTGFYRLVLPGTIKEMSEDTMVTKIMHAPTKKAAQLPVGFQVKWKDLGSE
eukprot:1233497-Lingulodinium_polyedra.AAC.1